MRWPDGVGRTLELRGRARDLRTDEHGAARVLGDAAFQARVAYATGREVVELSTTPAEPKAAKLVGARASTGFRAVLDEALPNERDARSLLYLLLDDVPVTALVGGYAIGKAMGGHTAAPKLPRRSGPALQHPDLCAGWRTGGTMLVEIESTGRIPFALGPAAPPLARSDDPMAWHELDPMPADSMRRHRRLDLVRDGGAIALDVLFRDSHMDGDGLETIVHEYTVRGRVDAASLTIEEIEATPQVLPWTECPAAADSAGRLRGRPLAGLRPHVRSELTGASTCTHLNDTLRSLEDVIALVQVL